MEKTPEYRELVKKITEACNEVKPVEKRGDNKFHGYKYQKASDVAKAFRHALFSRGVLLLPDEEDPVYVDKPTRDGGKWTECHLKVIYEMTDGEASKFIRRNGVGLDSGDKALAKAQTAAEKSFLKRLGLIPDEREDPEADTSVDEAFAEQEQLPLPPQAAAPASEPKRRGGKPRKVADELPQTTFGRLFHVAAGLSSVDHIPKTEEEQRAYIRSLTGGSDSANDIPPAKRNEAMVWARSGVPLPTEQ